jgi:2-aminoadipate transaminase
MSPPESAALGRRRSAAEASPEPAFSLSHAALAGGAPRLREILGRASRPGVISLAVGLPASDLLPVRQLAACQAHALADPAAWQYALPSLPLKRQLVALMASRGVTCAAEQVFLTSGSQQGMDLLARLLVDPGAAVLLEETVYDGILLALCGHAPRLVTVASEPETGMDVAAVEAALTGGVRPRFLYTIPNGHNPLGLTLSAAKRIRLVELARRFAFPVAEDDAYGSLYYGESPPPPMRALEDRWVFYLGSFSKILAPALRIGWLVVPEELIPRLSALKHGADLDTPSIGQHVAAAFLESGALAEHLAALRREYRVRRDTMLQCLAACLPPSVRWNRPESGLFVWVELPRAIDATALLEFAIDSESVAFTPGDVFAAAGHRHARHCLRLCFSSCRPEQIAAGVERLARALERFAPAAC